MHKVTPRLLSLLAILCMLHSTSLACSVGKITSNGTTWFGNNEDNWRTNPKIQFKPGDAGQYGAAFFLFGDMLPQGGINTEGLAFDGLTVHRQPRTKGQNLAHFGSNSEFLRYAMHHFSNVDEVYQYMTDRNMSLSNRGMFIFSDRFGKILIAEPDTLILTDDDDFVIANYCPSQTDDAARMEFARYRRGIHFLQDGNIPRDSASCLKLMQVMHESRPDHHDGTLYTFVANLNSQVIHIAFYHDFTQWHEINLHEELQKGHHTIEISQWFPANPDYQHLQEYQTSFNNNPIRLYLGLLAIFSFIILISRLWLAFRRRNHRTVYAFSALLSLTITASACFFITDQSLFYMAPDLFSAIGKTGWIKVFMAFLSIFIATGLVFVLYRQRRHSTGLSNAWIPSLQIFGSLPLFILYFYWGVLF